MSCSRRAFDAYGRPVVVATTSTLGIEAGTVFRMLGDSIRCTVSGDERLFAWTGKSGRPPTPREQMEARPPYQPAASRRERERREPDDAELTDAEAIEWARREQQRNPPDLIAA
jgi:hypothetical protein